MERRNHCLESVEFQCIGKFTLLRPKSAIDDVLLKLRLVDIIQSLNERPRPHFNRIQVDLHVRQDDTLVARLFGVAPCFFCGSKILRCCVSSLGLLICLPTEVSHSSSSNCRNDKCCERYDNRPGIPPDHAIINP